MTLAFPVLQHGLRPLDPLDPLAPRGMEAPVEESIAHQAGIDAAWIDQAMWL